MKITNEGLINSANYYKPLSLEECISQILFSDEPEKVYDAAEGAKGLLIKKETINFEEGLN